MNCHNCGAQLPDNPVFSIGYYTCKCGFNYRLVRETKANKFGQLIFGWLAFSVATMNALFILKIITKTPLLQSVQISLFILLFLYLGVTHFYGSSVSWKGANRRKSKIGNDHKIVGYIILAVVISLFIASLF